LSEDTGNRKKPESWIRELREDEKDTLLLIYNDLGIVCSIN